MEDKDRYFLLSVTLKRVVRGHQMVWQASAVRYGVEIASATAYWPADAVNGCLYDVDVWLKKNAEQDASGTQSFSARPRKKVQRGSAKRETFERIKGATAASPGKPADGGNAEKS